MNLLHIRSLNRSYRKVQAKVLSRTVSRQLFSCPMLFVCSEIFLIISCFLSISESEWATEQVYTSAEKCRTRFFKANQLVHLNEILSFHRMWHKLQGLANRLGPPAEHQESFSDCPILRRTNGTGWLLRFSIIFLLLLQLYKRDVTILHIKT